MEIGNVGVRQRAQHVLHDGREANPGCQPFPGRVFEDECAPQRAAAAVSIQAGVGLNGQLPADALVVRHIPRLLNQSAREDITGFRVRPAWGGGFDNKLSA